MSSKQAAIDRANKLLRLAAPSANNSESERTSAALEAAKVIAENNLIVSEKIEQKRIPRPQRPASVDWIAREAQRAAQQAAEQDGFFARTSRRKNSNSEHERWNQNWNELVITQSSPCVVCKRLIHAGERAWFDSALGWRHYEIDCDQKL